MLATTLTTLIGPIQVCSLDSGSSKCQDVVFSSLGRCVGTCWMCKRRRCCCRERRSCSENGPVLEITKLTRAAIEAVEKRRRPAAGAWSRRRQSDVAGDRSAGHFWRRCGGFLHSEGLDERWKSCLAAGEGVKMRFQYCTDDSGTIVYFRALQGHSGRNLIDPSLQDNVVIPSNFFQHMYHIGCAFNLHSIINSGLIPGSKRQTVFFLPVDPMDQSHKDPKAIDLNVPRHAQYLHKAWKRHQDAVYWVDINLAIEKGLTFYQTRSNAIILQGTLPAYCIPKVVRIKTGQVLYEKVYMSPRPPPKISLKHEWKRELGPEHAQRPEVGQLSRSFQSNQPTLNPIRERSGRPDVTHDVIGVQDERKTSRSLEIDVNSFREEPRYSERTGRPVTRPIPGKPVHETSVIQTRSSEDRENFNVEQTHERTVRPVITHDVTSVPDSSQTRSAHESETFNVEDEILRKRTARSVADHDASHESMMVNEAGHGLPNSRATTFRCEARAEYQRSRIDRTIQIDMLFNKIYDKIHHLIFSVQNQNK